MLPAEYEKPGGPWRWLLSMSMGCWPSEGCMPMSRWGAPLLKGGAMPPCTALMGPGPAGMTRPMCGGKLLL